jgi:hypothetical protein
LEFFFEDVVDFDCRLFCVCQHMYREQPDVDVVRLLTLNTGDDSILQEMFHGIELCLSGAKRSSIVVPPEHNNDDNDNDDNENNSSNEIKSSVDDDNNNSTIQQENRSTTKVERRLIIASALRLLTCIAEQCLHSPFATPHWLERFLIEVFVVIFLMCKTLTNLKQFFRFHSQNH